MSVINKMLRDLDARHSASRQPAQPEVVALDRGTSKRAIARVMTRRSLRLLAALLLLVGAGAVAWYYQQQSAGGNPLGMRGATPPVPVPVAQPVVSPAASPAQTAPSAMAVIAAPASTPQTGQPSVPPASPMPLQVQTKVAQASAATLQTTQADTKPGKSTASRVRPATSPAGSTGAPLAGGTKLPAKVASTPVAAASVPAVAASADALARETLVQARQLWAQGARAGARSLLRDALDARDVVPTMRAELLQELARMELTDGHAAETLALLERLDGAQAGQAELWALRGNAAQRLARHQEAAQAYQTAARLRPGETRWMLGAAVSLAALGQLEQAAAWTERARAAGSVNPEVLGYLRQAGVPLRER